MSSRTWGGSEEEEEEIEEVVDLRAGRAYVEIARQISVAASREEKRVGG